MPTKLGLLRGKKFNPKGHTSIIPEATRVITAATRHEAVKHITPSIIRGKGSRTPRLKIATIPAGLRVTVHGSSEMQVVFIYTDKPTEVADAISSAW